MKIGDIVEGTVTGIQGYGAFVDFEDGGTGLIHISEVKAGYIDSIYQLIRVGQSIRVQVIDVDEYTGKASLSLRTLDAPVRHVSRHHRFTSERHKSGFRPLADAMLVWTEEALKDLRDQASR